MAGYYHHNPNLPPYYHDNSQIPLQSHGYDPRLHQFQALSSDHLTVNYPEYDESSRPLLVAQGSARARRRHIASGEHVKHRRTRSGCYTCRTRRVKCDEAHPVCERCRKGNRDCVYPEPSTTSKSSRSSAKAKDSSQESGESGDDAEHDEKGALESIPDEEDSPGQEPPEYQRASVSSASQSAREVSDPPSLTYGKSPTPSTDGSHSLSSGSIPQIRPSVSSTSSRPTARKLAPSRSWSDLPPDLLYYINYYRTSMSHYHLFIKNDSTDYMRTTFVEIATRNEPLLYAVVGFAAYHHTLTRPNGKIQDFLKYYNKSISLLRASIQRNQRQNVAILLTILQLASFEEYLGDWVNLLGHQRAAYEVLTSLYTPQTIMQNETLRKILQWYIRFDLYASVIAGCGTILGREWVAAAYEYYAQQAVEKPNDIEYKYEERIFRSRLLATDIAILFSRRARATIDNDSFAIECDNLRRQFDMYEVQIDPALRDPSKLVTSFSGSPLRDPCDAVSPASSETLYGDNLFSTNFLLVDFWAMDLMLRHHLLTAGLMEPAEAAGLTAKALKVYNMFEAIERYPHSPPGAVVATQASLNVASFFLPRDDKYNMWMRRSLAKVESLGYIFPTTLRAKISEHWGVDCHWWWLPNDEGLPPLIRTMRKFAEERTMAPKDQAAEDLRDMKGLFKFTSLSISDSPGSTESQGTHMDTSDVLTDQSPDGVSMPPDDSLLYDAQPDLSWGVGHDRFTEY